MRAAMFTPSPKMSLAVDDDVADMDADPVPQVTGPRPRRRRDTAIADWMATPH